MGDPLKISPIHLFRIDGNNIMEKSNSTTEVLLPSKNKDSRSRYTILSAAAVTIALVLVLLFIETDRITTGFLVMCLIFAMLVAGVPIAFGMLGGSLLGLWKLGGFGVVETTFSESIFMGAASWQLSVIPLFVLMGIAMWRSGLTKQAFDAARAWLGWLPGGLAVATNFAGAGLASASGSSIGISYALGRIAIPEMLRAKYQPALATGVVAMAGTLGQLIPPSILLVIYAGVVQVPVGPQLLAAVVPGVLIAFGFAAMIVVRTSINPSLAPRGNVTAMTMSARIKSLTGLVPIGLVIAVVIGGLFTGVFTPTEAGAFGALTALIVGWLMTGKENRKFTAMSRFVMHSLRDTVITTSAIFLMIIGVTIFGRVMTLSRMTNALADWVVGMGMNKIAFLLILIVLYLILGLILEPTALILLTVPVFAAPLATLGVDMIWFGVFIVIMAEIAIVSPPIGMLVFIVHRLAQLPEVNLGTRITLNDVYKGVLWFIAVALGLLVLFIFFPEIVLWLPGLSSAQ
jgi:C4-dicarboxylate transporter, DctM subunit